MDERASPGSGGNVGTAARVFGVDTILTTVAAESFSGLIFTEITYRTTMNMWQNGRITNRINNIGKDRLVLAELCTGARIVGLLSSPMPAATCRPNERGAHGAGRRPPDDSLQYLLEPQCGRASVATYDAVMDVAKKFGSSHGIGVTYAKAMLGAHASEGGSPVAVGRGRLRIRKLTS